MGIPARIVPAVVLGMLSMDPARAEQPAELDQIIVTAALEPLSARDVASSVTVITREEIEQRQARFLADLLRDVPGFNVSQSGGAGSQTQVRVRGAEANQMLVLVDGIRANDAAASDEFQWQYALTSDIERIEIVRGPQSAVWGSDAVAGVINIIRRSDTSGHSASGRMEAGSFGTLDLGARGAWESGPVRVRGGVSRYRTDGTNISRTGGEADGTDNTTFDLGLQYHPSEVLELYLTGRQVDAANDFDEIDYGVTGLPVDADRVTEAEQGYWGGELRYRPSDSAWSGNASLNYTDTDNRNFADGVWSSSTAAETLEGRLRVSRLWGGEQAPGRHRLTFALDRRDTDFAQRGIASPFGDPNQDQSHAVTGYAAEYVGHPLAGFTWTLSGRHDDNTAFKDVSTWQVAGSHWLNDRLRLRGSVGTGSKAPTFTERYGFYEDFFAGNPALRPETSRGWEAGLDSNWLDGAFELDLAWYATRLEDEIDSFVFDPASGYFTAVNKATPSHRRGLEVVATAHPLAGLALSANYSYTDATETGPDGRMQRELRRPRHMGSLNANCRFADGRANLNLNLNYTGEQLDVFFDPATFVAETVRLGSYTVLDLSGSWRLNGALELVARVTNLGDTQYEEVLGFARPGRAWYAGLRARFGP